MKKTERTPLLLLASRSPRRKDLLKMAGIPFRYAPSDVEETMENSPEKTVMKNALAKARAVSSQREKFVLGADTVVRLGRKTMGKPRNTAEAERFLSLLSGRTHTVYSGIALLHQGKTWTGYARTRVFFDRLSSREIRTYVKNHKPLDKAGAYGIQEFSALYIRKIEGDYFNVVGLPLNLLYRLLKKSGYPLDLL